MNIIVVDDHKMFRESVVSFLEAEPFCEQAFAASTVAEARTLITEHTPQVALVDLSFPGEGGLTLVEWATAEVPEMACVFLTMHEEMSNLRAAISAGGRGYVTKNAGYDELRNAVMVAAAGGQFLDQMMMRRVFSFLGQEQSRGNVPKPTANLTEREREICNLMLQDMSTAEIGNALFISAKTVENHRSSIYRKLGVHDRLSLFNFARTNEML